MKHTLFAAAAIGMSLFAHNALAGQTCAYVIGDIDGELVTTAAVLLSVPPGSVDVDPIVVHVDETDQTIAGYSFHVPGVDEGWDPDEIFIPGAEAASSAMVETLAELDLDLMFCLEGSRTTPAIPIYIPASELTAPPMSKLLVSVSSTSTKSSGPAAASFAFRPVRSTPVNSATFVAVAARSGARDLRMPTTTGPGADTSTLPSRARIRPRDPVVRTVFRISPSARSGWTTSGVQATNHSSARRLRRNEV